MAFTWGKLPASGSRGPAPLSKRQGFAASLAGPGAREGRILSLKVWRGRPIRTGDMRTALVLVCALSTGCSVVFMETVEPSWTASEEPRCSASAGWPLLDLAWAGSAGLLVAKAADDAQKLEDADALTDSARSDYETTRNAGIAVAGVYTASAVYGMVKVNRCNNARRQRDVWVAERERMERDRRVLARRKVIKPRPRPVAAPAQAAVEAPAAPSATP